MSGVTLYRDRTDPLATAVPVGRAVERLRVALSDRGLSLEEDPPTEGLRDGTILAIAGEAPPGGTTGQDGTVVPSPTSPEAFTIVTDGGRSSPRTTSSRRAP